MRACFKIHSLLLAAFFLGFRAFATTYYVDVNSTSPTPPYTSWSTAATDIQSAIDQSSAGDLVLVNDGIYQTGGETVSGVTGTNRVAITLPITVQSVNGPGVTAIEGYQMPGATNGNNAIRCAYITNNAALIGFTLTNGATQNSTYGGGIYGKSTQCLVSNCVIIGNSASIGGGGVYQALLVNCLVFGNDSAIGGGVYSANLANCMVVSNSCLAEGGGAFESSLTNCVVACNSGPTNQEGAEGGGAYFTTLINCTITGNSAWQGGGADGCVMTNCIDYYNAASYPDSSNYYGSFPMNWCCTAPNPGGIGNITNEPMLASLSQINPNSPCRGAGNPAATSGVDINGNPWANPPSIGCNEPYPGNITGNISVNISASTTNIAAGYPIYFVASISGLVSVSSWNFGDGTAVTNEPYMSHAWSAAGTYPVILTAYNDSYPSGQSVTNFVTVYQPTVFYVVSSANQYPIAPYDSWAKAATNIQSAVNAAIPGGLILVSNGVYNAGTTVSSDGGTNRVAVTQPLTVQSVNGAAFTSIDGGNQFRCIYLTNGAILNGFTLTNGNTPIGGGAYCASTNAFLENCLLTKNTGNNGCVYSGTISNSTIMANSGPGAEYGTLFNCTISSNSSWGAEYSTLNSCLVSSNRLGGAEYSTLYNSVIASNIFNGLYFCTATVCKVVSTISVAEGEESPVDGGEYTNCLIIENGFGTSGAMNASFVNCTLFNNSEYANCTFLNCLVYNDYQGNIGIYAPGCNFTNCCAFPLPSSGFGNFTNPPLVVNITNDFHLQSNSPCINSGNNAYIAAATDFDGNPRIRGGTVDIGCYEYQTPKSVISYAYLQQYGLPTDGSVDSTDIDGTGFNVYQDWLAGLNPTNPVSILVMLPVTTTNIASGITVTWQSVSGIPYNLQRSTNLSVQPPFSTIQSNITGQAGTTSYTDTSATNSMPYFYRVGVP